MYREDGESLKRGADKEYPLNDCWIYAIPHDKEAEDPRETEGGHKNYGGLKEGAINR